MVFECRWGILATGGIAATFTKDLLVDPATRDVADVRHRVVAVASSSSAERARTFCAETGCPASTKALGSYAELVAEPDVAIIYVATPHSHHYENVLTCLEAGKSVLCEKAFTINAKQAAHLVRVAKEKNLFLMEAVWTRFFPIAYELQRLLFEEKVIGQVRKVVTDFGMPFDLEDTKHRLLNPELGGGSLLDLGIYNLTWIRMLCFSDPRNEGTEPEVSASMMKTEATGVDEHTHASLLFGRSRVSATMQCNMVVKSDEEAVVRIQGDEGDITIPWPPPCPTSFTIYKKPKPVDTAAAQPPVEDPIPGDKRVFEIPGGAVGMVWEQDECARCLRDGKLESERMPLRETLATMTIMDTMRAQNDFKYPDHLERVVE